MSRKRKTFPKCKSTQNCSVEWEESERRKCTAQIKPEWLQPNLERNIKLWEIFSIQLDTLKIKEETHGHGTHLKMDWMQVLHSHAVCTWARTHPSHMHLTHLQTASRHFQNLKACKICVKLMKRYRKPLLWLPPDLLTSAFRNMQNCFSVYGVV